MGEGKKEGIRESGENWEIGKRERESVEWGKGRYSREWGKLGDWKKGKGVGRVGKKEGIRGSGENWEIGKREREWVEWGKGKERRREGRDMSKGTGGNGVE